MPPALYQHLMTHDPRPAALLPPSAPHPHPGHLATWRTSPREFLVLCPFIQPHPPIPRRDLTSFLPHHPTPTPTPHTSCCPKGSAMQVRHVDDLVYTSPKPSVCIISAA